MEFNELMQSFAAKFGMASIDINDDFAALEIDGMAFGFIHNPGKETLTLVADLGQAAIDANGEFGSMMLKANFLFEATNDMLKRCRFYNREATVVRTMRY